MRPSPFVLTAATLFAIPATGSAQIIRDPAPATPPPAVAPAPVPVLTPFDVARNDQRAFEAFRRVHLPHIMPRLPGATCDEKVGRFCYWYDESTALPKESPDVTARRRSLIAGFDSVARLLPDNIWISEQRVRYLAEAERYDDALTAAKSCTVSGWRCEILVGFAHHMLGDYVEAERVYDVAIGHMGPRESCDWRDMSLLLDDVAQAQYRALPCGNPARDAWAARTWFLARTLYSMKGNDSRSEYFARMTMVIMLQDAPGPHQFGFDDDERELLLRFGWPRAWAALAQLPFTVALASGPQPGTDGGSGGSGGPGSLGGAKGRGRGGTPVGSLPPGTKVPPSVPPLVRPPDMPGGRGVPGGITGGPPDARPRLPQLPRAEVKPREGDGINVVGMEAVPAYRYIPAGFVLNDPPQSDSAAWRLQLPPVMGRYAPPYAKTLVPLVHQKAVFKRGDSAIVVMAYETKGTDVENSPIRAGLVVTPAGPVARDFAAVRDSAAPTGVLTVHAPWGPLLMSAEVAAPARHAVARARYGVGPLRIPAFRVVLSDLLFYKSHGSFPTSVEEVAPHALSSERVWAKEKLGVYWEAYGTDPEGEKMHVSLIVLRENAVEEEGGFFRRLGKAVGLGRDGTPVSVSVDDVSARALRTSTRAIELDISTLKKGAYIVQLEITVVGQPVLRAEHRIEVVEP